MQSLTIGLVIAALHQACVEQGLDLIPPEVIDRAVEILDELEKSDE